MPYMLNFFGFGTRNRDRDKIEEVITALLKEIEEYSQKYFTQEIEDIKDKMAPGGLGEVPINFTLTG